MMIINRIKSKMQRWNVQNKMLQLINITSISEPTSHESMPNNVAQDQPKYYVHMHIVSTTITKKNPEKMLQVSLDF